LIVTADGSVPDGGGTSQGSNTKAAQADRPVRPCPFCGKLLVRLSRHLQAVHKTEESVKSCLKGSYKERYATFQQLKRAGILKYNMQVAIVIKTFVNVFFFFYKNTFFNGFFLFF